MIRKAENLSFVQMKKNDGNIKTDLPTNTYINWKANVLTLYPEMFPGSLNFGVIGNALKRGIWSLEITDIKKFAIGKHKNVDERPIGGGPGMILRSDVIDNTLNSIRENESKNHPLIYLTPKGNRLSQELVERFSKTDGVTILCGRFGGIDERVITHYNPIEISVGDFILSGAEIAAQALIDSTVRLLPGTLGNTKSTNDESFSRHLLEHPQYTKPNIWKGFKVPDILFSGDHQAIKSWRFDQSKIITKERRSDLWKKFLNSDIRAPKGDK